MIWSVSTLARSSGATSPFSVVNFSISVSSAQSSSRSSSLSLPVSNVDEMPRDRGCCGHLRAHEMGPAAGTLPSLKIAVRGRGAALARLQVVGVHAQAHRASRFAPLETRVLENSVEALGFRLRLHQSGARHDQRE